MIPAASLPSAFDNRYTRAIPYGYFVSYSTDVRSVSTTDMKRDRAQLGHMERMPQDRVNKKVAGWGSRNPW